MKHLLLISIIAAGSLAAACTSGDREEEEKPKGGVIGEAYIESLEEAEAVEDLAIERSDRLAEEIEAAENPD